MQKLLIWVLGSTIAIGLGTGLSLAVSRVSTKLRAPRIVLSDELVDFSEPSFGQEESAYVTLENRGRATLKILRVHVSCGCTRAVLEEDEVPAGNTTRLKITASGSRLGVPQHNTVKIATNDPAHPVVQIEILIHPFKSFGFSPGEIDFGRIESNRLPVTEMILLKLEDRFPASQLGTLVESDLPYVSSEIVSWDVAGKSLSALVKLDASAPAGEIVGRVAIRLPGSHREHSAQIAGCVVGDYFAEPPAIVWGPIRNDDATTSHAIRVQPRNSEPLNFKITGTTRGSDWPAEGLDVSIVEGPGNPELRLTCDPANWSDPWSTRRLRTSVRVSIQNSEAKASELNVPVELVLEN